MMDSFGGTPPPAPVQQVAAPTAIRPAATTAGGEATKVTNPNADLDPTLHPGWMAQAESIEYTGNGRNIFSLSSAPVAIPEAIKTARNTQPTQVVDTGPPPPPPPPPIELKFFGFSARQSGLRRAFFLKGDDVFIASEGDVVDHRYKVVKIAPTSVQVEDIPYSNTQSLPLIQN
jgi:hypothetical protein